MVPDTKLVDTELAFGTGIEQAEGPRDPLGLRLVMVYPIKGARPLVANSAVWTPEGLGVYESEALVTDHSGCFVDMSKEVPRTLGQKQVAILARLGVGIGLGELQLEFDGVNGSIALHPGASGAVPIQAMMFPDKPLINLEIHREDNDRLDQLMRVLFPKNGSVRFARATAGGNLRRVREKKELGMTYVVPRTGDGEGVHLVSAATVGDLNRRLESMSDSARATYLHFRAQIVINGDPENPYDEFSWQRVVYLPDGEVGEPMYFRVVPTKRCDVPGINPRTGRRDHRSVLGAINAIGASPQSPYRRSGLIQFDDSEAGMAERNIPPFLGVYLAPEREYPLTPLVAGGRFVVVSRWR